MKGVVFVELLSMAETLLGEDTVDDILENSNLASGGAYSSVGNYPCSELMTLVGAFSQSSGQPAAVLQAAFGNWIFGKFSESYTTFFEGKNRRIFNARSDRKRGACRGPQDLPRGRIAIFPHTAHKT